MNYIGLFSGIGGFALGAYWADMKFDKHYFSEVEPYAVELYQKRFPDAIPLGDITKIDTGELRESVGNCIITGGFPCQDISIAGKGEGIHGKRSGLWFEYWRLINDLRPRFAIMENVGMLIHRGLREVLGSLAEIGYNAEWQDIRAGDMGAPHKRERIWIVAYPVSTGTRSFSGEVGANKGGNSGGNESTLRQKNRENGPNRIDATNKTEGEITNATCKLSYRSREEGPGRGEFTDNRIEELRKEGYTDEQIKREIPDTDRQYDDNTGHGASEICGERSETPEISGRMADTPSKRLEGLLQNRKLSSSEFAGCSKTIKSNWPIEPAVCGMDDGLSDELYGYQGRLTTKSHKRVNRLKGLGNAIVPQIAELLFKQIKELI